MICYKDIIHRDVPKQNHIKSKSEFASWPNVDISKLK